MGIRVAVVVSIWGEAMACNVWVEYSETVSDKSSIVGVEAISVCDLPMAWTDWCLRLTDTAMSLHLGPLIDS